MSKILIAGAGAIGCWLGARLDMAGHDVSLLGRQQLVDAGGVAITGFTEHEFQPRIFTEHHDETFDVAFVTCKAHQTVDIAQLASLAAGDGIVASLQNGIGNAEILSEVHGDVVTCLTSHGVKTVGPGAFNHAGRGPTIVGGPTEAAQIIERLLHDAELDPQWTDNILGAVWTKAAVNAAINPLAALLGLTNGELAAAHEAECLDLAEEVYALSRAAGVKLPMNPVEATRETLAGTAANKCSMLQDVEAKRPTEIEQITGYFVRAARRLGYPLFKNEEVYHRLKELEGTYLDEDIIMARVRAAVDGFSLPGET